MKEDKDLLVHWYHYNFYDEYGYHTTYMGYELKDQITPTMIDSAKDLAGCTENSVMISLSYLGCMSKNQFIGDDDES